MQTENQEAGINLAGFFSLFPFLKIFLNFKFLISCYFILVSGVLVKLVAEFTTAPVCSLRNTTLVWTPTHYTKQAHVHFPRQVLFPFLEISLSRSNLHASNAFTHSEGTVPGKRPAGDATISSASRQFWCSFDKCIHPCTVHSSHDMAHFHHVKSSLRPFLRYSPAPPASGNPWSDFRHHRLVLLILEFHVCGTTRYILFRIVLRQCH